MAIPKTEVDRRMDRIELAISTMAHWIVESQPGFGKKHAKRIDDILRGIDGREDGSPPASENSPE